MDKYNLKNPTQNKCQIPNLEDIYMEHIGYKEDGYYVEVGGFDGLSWSNTFGLAVKGWSGLILEPQPDYFQTCTENYEPFEKVKVIQTCAGNITGEIKLYTGYSLATTKQQMVKEYNKIDWFKGIVNEHTFVISPIDTLNNILLKNAIPNEFDVLVVDVEGAELDVIKGLDLTKWFPKMIIIELHEDNEYESLKRDSPEINKILSTYYKKVFKDENNSIFVRN